MAERDIKNMIDEYFQGVFDEVKFDRFGGVRLVKHAVLKSPRPAKIMLDAHIDQIGLVVTEILGGGFLRVKSLGGLDLNILPASEFYVYTYEENEPFIFDAARKILAVAVSVPPHLKKTAGNTLPKLEEIYLDTGYDSKEELEKIVRVGSPVTFRSKFLSLENNLVSCAAMDDRLCAAILMLAVKSLETDPGVEIHIVLSVSEETTGFGAAAAAFEIQPDFAVAFDGGFSKDPGVDPSGSFEINKGAGISYSAATNIKLTKKIIALAKDKNIPLQIIAEPGETNTNADTIQITGEGVPCALISVPIKNMHTFNEICSLDDAEKTVGLVRAVIENAGGLI
jgi:endoglucanase